MDDRPQEYDAGDDCNCYPFSSNDVHQLSSIVDTVDKKIKILNQGF